MYVYCCDTNDKQRFKWKRKKNHFRPKMTY